jgi:hypothetical protein
VPGHGDEAAALHRSAPKSWYGYSPASTSNGRTKDLDVSLSQRAATGLSSALPPHPPTKAMKNSALAAAADHQAWVFLIANS